MVVEWMVSGLGTKHLTGHGLAGRTATLQGLRESTLQSIRYMTQGSGDGNSKQRPPAPPYVTHGGSRASQRRMLSIPHTHLSELHKWKVGHRSNPVHYPCAH